ncbi:predicted protein [Naegleria gruberi]|uniref:Predicted protein n=1 Tax=Naegleria gruberi TaxID=5762 RepID=D2VI56_NAEGR|nr:uncharacterized protein NAEGRDRAFT_68569 [Naegleria gruberi]EFC43532.1 predicted protein [Naegleria gruberi]|eukprot:XP_002676276.1 predicted protein [Naegleria gruberi strain NEG-M]
MKSLNSSNIPYWETQLLNQITKISDKKLIFQKKCEVCDGDSFDRSKLTKERKIEQKFVNAYCHKIEKLSAKSKRNQDLFNSIKVVNFEDVPRNLELLKPILKLFPNVEHLRLVDIFCFGMDKIKLDQIYDKCTKLELRSKYECGSTLDNIQHFPNLEYLSFYGGLTLEKADSLKQLKNLTTLQILDAKHDNHNDSMVDVCASLSEFPKLKTLIIDTNRSDMESIIQLSNSKTLSRVKLQTLLLDDFQMIQGFPELKSLTFSDCIPLIHLSKLEKLEYFEFTIPTYPGLSRVKFRFLNLGLLTSLTTLKVNQIEWEYIFGDKFRKEVCKLAKLTTLIVELYGDYDSNNCQFKEFYEWLTINLKQFNCFTITKYDKSQHKKIIIKF